MFLVKPRVFLGLAKHIIGLLPRPSKSFPIHHLAIILLFDAVSVVVRNGKLNP
jgi:hypothetical protein